MEKKRNELLNIMEAVAAMLVVFIHIPFPNPLGNMVTALARVSVPFFFCISGYFFYQGDPEREMASIPRKIKRLLLLLCMSETVYFLFYLLLQIDNIGFTFQAVKNVVVPELQNSNYLGPMDRIAVFEPLFNGTFWFVGSLITVYICVNFMVKYSWQKAALILSLVTLGIGFVLRRMLAHAGIYTSFPYERLLPALPVPFFMVGYFIRKHQDRCSRMDDKVYVCAFAGGVLLTLAEQFFGRHTLYAGTLVLVPALLAFCGKHSGYTPRKGVECFFSRIGAEPATYIYMLHMMVGNILAVLVPRFLGIDPKNAVYMWLFPLLVWICSAVTGVAICFLKRILFMKR